MNDDDLRRLRIWDDPGETLCLEAAAEIEQLRKARAELAYIVAYFQGGIRPLDLRDWWRRSCEILKSTGGP